MSGLLASLALIGGAIVVSAILGGVFVVGLYWLDRLWG